MTGNLKNVNLAEKAALARTADARGEDRDANVAERDKHRAAGRPVLGRPRRHPSNAGDGPLFESAREWTAATLNKVAEKLRHAPYAHRFIGLFGESIFLNPRLLVSEAMFAIGRYQIEEPSFHPYTSKFDYWLEGKARLSDKRNARLSFVQ